MLFFEYCLKVDFIYYCVRQVGCQSGGGKINVF